MTVPTVAYIGLDHSHAALYLDSLDELPVEVTCVCEPAGSTDPITYDGIGDVPIYADPETLFASEQVDIAWISLSNRRTPGVLKLAADYGIDVYAEKPLARTASELEAVADTVQNAGITVVAGYQNRGTAVSKDLRRRVAGGFFGDLRAVELRMVTSQLQYRDLTDDVYDVIASRGGILQWLGCHYIDLIQWVLDDPIASVSATVTYGSDDVEIEDGATMQFRTTSGTLGTLHAGYYDRSYDTYVGLHGRDGRASWDPSAGDAEVDVVEYESYDGRWTDSTRRVIHEYDSRPGYGGAIGLDYMNAFLQARTGAPAALDYVATLDEAMRVLRVLDAAYESVESDEWVSVDSTDR